MGMASFRGKKFPIVPYGCLYIDASWSDVLAAIPFSIEPSHHRSLMEYKLDRLWNHGHATPTPILPCLSVRTAFDLYLSVKKYPPGSEMVFCAINIPDMARIVRHHGIKVVALDVDIQTMTPKVEHLKSLITPRTVAILVAHLYGRWINLEDIIAIAKKHHLDILEDCAEAFCGVKNHGHPEADITFFSFGLIKTSTAFGGAIAVVRNPVLLSQMRTLYHSYPIRARSVYLKKLLKYSIVMTVLNSPFLVKHGTLLLNALGINHRELIVKCVRGFPSDFFANIRMRPSITLLCMLYRRLKNFDLDSFHLGNIKGDFVSRRLPLGIQGVGLKAEIRNYWLFPLVVDDPERLMKELNARGVDAYRGATQLDLIESDVAIPRNLSNPAEKVPQSTDDTSETTEDASSVDKAMHSGGTGVAGDSGDMTGTVRSGSDRGRGFLQGQWKAEDGYTARTSPQRTCRTGCATIDSDCDFDRELLHNESSEKSPDHRDNSLEMSSASRNRTSGSLQTHEDNTQDASLKQCNVERANVHAKEATEQSNNLTRGLTWIAQSHHSNTSTMPSKPYVTCPGSSELHRNSETPAESQQQSHFGNVSDDLTAINGNHSLHCAPVSNYGAPSASSTVDTQGLQPVTYSHLQHQRIHHESHAQGISHLGSVKDSLLRSNSTNKLDSSSVDQKRTTANHASSNHRVTCSPKHPQSSEDPFNISHTSNTAVVGATDTERESTLPPSNTDSSYRGGSIAIPSQSVQERSGKSPGGTLGDSPRTMSGKYPSEARYLIEHVVYLPVHKKVSFHYLEQICAVLEDVASTLAREKRVKIKSKL